MFKTIGIGICALIASATCMLPAPAHATRGSTTAAAAIISGIAGAMVGAGLQKSADKDAQRRCCQRQCYCAPPQRVYCQRMVCTSEYQRMLMRQTMNSYDPNYHCRFVEYVTIDLAGYLTPCQQQQLIDLMNQRRAACMNGCLPPPPPCGCAGY